MKTCTEMSNLNEIKTAWKEMHIDWPEAVWYAWARLEFGRVEL